MWTLCDRVPEEGPAEAAELMEACMQSEPSMRPTAKDLIHTLQELTRSH